MGATIPTLDEIRAAVREELARAVADLRRDHPEEMLTMAEYGRRMGVSSRTVQRWVQAGEVRSVAVGRTRRIPASAVTTDPDHPSPLRSAG